MVFVPTPKLFVRDTNRKYVYVFNFDNSPLPEELEALFLSSGGKKGEAKYDNRLESCWIFEKKPPVSELETTYYLIEKSIRDFRQKRGEDLCSIRDEDEFEDRPKEVKEEEWSDDFTVNYIRQLKRREALLEKEEDAFRHKGSYEEYEQRQRALYRAANLHPQWSYWKTYQEGNILSDYQKELEKEEEYGDKGYTERRLKSGIEIGSQVKTAIVPKGARTIPVPKGTIGTVEEDRGLYVIVKFPLPLTDESGSTWEPFEEKTTIGVGYTIDEIELVR